MDTSRVISERQKVERRSTASRAVRPVAKIVSAFVEPVFYWLGLLDPQGHPANSKMIYTASACVALFTIYKIGTAQIAKGGQISVEYVALVCIVLLFCASVEAFKKVMASRLSGSSTTTTTDVSTQRSSTTVDQVSAPPAPE